MCPKCDGFTERLTFATPDEYRAFVRQLIELVNKHNLSLKRADCRLEDLLTAPWPTGDTILHNFQCAGCGRRFELCVNVWNGRNWWRPERRPEKPI
jgi:hypothetical protein